VSASPSVEKFRDAMEGAYKALSSTEPSIPPVELDTALPDDIDGEVDEKVRDMEEALVNSEHAQLALADEVVELLGPVRSDAVRILNTGNHARVARWAAKLSARGSTVAEGGPWQSLANAGANIAG